MRRTLERARSPWRNAATYAALDEGTASAPGQFTALGVERLLVGEGEPLVLGVLGGVEFVARSRGPLVHGLRGAARRACGLRPTATSAPRDLAALRGLGVRWAPSVTAPHKKGCRSVRRDALRGRRADRCGEHADVRVERVEAHQTDALGIERGC
ncbi:MAG: hypothetical protein R3F34_01855 [Planctomycetota bacterium]